MKNRIRVSSFSSFPINSLVQSKIVLNKHRSEYPNKQNSSRSRNQQRSQSDIENEQVTYEITVTTGSKTTPSQLSGRVGRVHILLIGTHGQIGPFELTSTDGKVFSWGARDTFRIQASLLGIIHRIRIWHDQSTIHSWFCNQIIIVDRSSINDTKYKFPICRWLDRDNGTGRIYLEVEQGKSAVQITTSKGQATCDVNTR